MHAWTGCHATFFQRPRSWRLLLPAMLNERAFGDGLHSAWTPIAMKWQNV